MDWFAQTRTAPFSLNLSAKIDLGLFCFSFLFPQANVSVHKMGMNAAASSDYRKTERLMLLQNVRFIS